MLSIQNNEDKIYFIKKKYNIYVQKGMYKDHDLRTVFIFFNNCWKQLLIRDIIFEFSLTSPLHMLIQIPQRSRYDH